MLVRFIILCFPILIGLILNSVSGARINTVEKFTHWRPGFGLPHEANNMAVQKWKRGRFDTTREVIDFARIAMRGISEHVASAVEEIVSEPTKNRDIPLPLRSAVNKCNTTIGRLGEAYSSLAQLENKLMDDSETCPFCTDVFDILQTLACNVDYNNLIDALITVCEIIFSNTGVTNPTMCNGTITVQAPFVVTTLVESMPYDFCQTLNLCYPEPKSSIFTVADRMAQILTDKRQAKEPEKKTSNGEIKILQLADIHISTIYAEGSAVDCGMYVCCMDEFPGTGSARKYGEYKCNIPERTMHHILDAAKNLQPDFIIYSGDSPPHSIWDETMASQLNCSQIVTKALEQKFNDTAIFPNIGNHEMYPTNIYTMDARYNNTAIMNQEFVNMWRKLAGFGPEQEQTMKKMAYYTMLVPGYDKLRILSINTNHFWYSLNFMAPLNRNTTAEVDHRAFIEQTLSGARTAGEKVIVVGHHPVASLDSTIRATRWWEDVMIQYSDVVIMQLSGHTHSDEFHLFLDPGTGDAKAINYVAPAFTTNTDVNPSIRLFTLDAVTHNVINYVSYFAELDTQTADQPPEVVKNYDVKADYGMADLSPSSWKELTIRFIENPELFQFWFKNRKANAVNDECTGECQKFQICSMWFPNYDEVDYCVTNWDSFMPPEQPEPDVGNHLTTTTCMTLLIVVLARFMCE